MQLHLNFVIFITVRETYCELNLRVCFKPNCHVCYEAPVTYILQANKFVVCLFFLFLLMDSDWWQRDSLKSWCEIFEFVSTLSLKLTREEGQYFLKYNAEITFNNSFNVFIDTSEQLQSYAPWSCRRGWKFSCPILITAGSCTQNM